MRLFREALFPLIAIVAAFAVASVLIVFVGENPLQVIAIFFKSGFGSGKDFVETLFYATPLIFTGLAVLVAFRCGLLNIGGEGQLTVAGVACAAFALGFGGEAVVGIGQTSSDWSVGIALPFFILIPACIAVTIIAGGIWGLIPGFLKARFGSHEVINTIMLNFVAIGLVGYITQYHLKPAGVPIQQSAKINEAAWIPKLHEVFGFLPQSDLNFSFLIAILMCVLVYVFLWRTKWGYELRAVGENPDAAEYGGISPKKQIIIAMTISGSLAGMAAIGEVLGFKHYYEHGFSYGLGFWGIAVALLGRNHPLGVLIAAFFFGMIIRGGLFIDIDTKFVSKDMVEILQALVIIFVASLQRYSK